MNTPLAARLMVIFSFICFNPVEGQTANDAAAVAAALDESHNPAAMSGAPAGEPASSGEDEGLSKFLEVGGSGNPQSKATVDHLLELSSQLEEAASFSASGGRPGEFPQRRNGGASLKPSAMPEDKIRTEVLNAEGAGLPSKAAENVPDDIERIVSGDDLPEAGEARAASVNFQQQ